MNCHRSTRGNESSSRTRNFTGGRSLPKTSACSFRCFLPVSWTSSSSVNQRLTRPPCGVSIYSSIRAKKNQVGCSRQTRPNSSNAWQSTQNKKHPLRAFAQIFRKCLIGQHGQLCNSQRVLRSTLFPQISRKTPTAVIQSAFHTTRTKPATPSASANIVRFIAPPVCIRQSRADLVRG